MANKIYYSNFYPDVTLGQEGTTVPPPVPTLDAPTSITFAADYEGDIIDGQLPETISVRRYSGEEDVSNRTNWSIATANCTASINSSGDITITDVVNTGSISVTSVHNNLTLRARINVVKTVGNPPTAGAGSVTESTVPPTTTDSYENYNPRILTLAAPDNGTVSLNANATFIVGTAEMSGSYGAYGKWQYRAKGSTTWMDVGSEQAAQSSCVIYGGQEA